MATASNLAWCLFLLQKLLIGHLIWLTVHLEPSYWHLTKLANFCGILIMWYTVVYCGAYSVVPEYAPQCILIDAIEGLFRIDKVYK